jgi:hypothetical protein
VGCGNVHIHVAHALLACLVVVVKGKQAAVHHVHECSLHAECTGLSSCWCGVLASVSSAMICRQWVVCG